jgi:ACS family hexuronate transporter-like MFS transporter
MTPDTERASLAGVGRSDTWRWFICGLLLLGTVVNYMDRLTVNTLAQEIQKGFPDPDGIRKELNDERYGQLELGFGLAFALGGTLIGCLVDWVGVYWLFPVVLLGWSIMGILTGLSHTFWELLIFRTLLGFFESGHFPCALKTIQLLLTPRDRAMGNSLLQGGTAVGAVVIQPVIRFLATESPDGWRPPFLVIGAAGCVWIVFWFLSMRPRDLRIPERVQEQAGPIDSIAAPASYWSLLFSRQFLALAIMVICINLNWHLFRVWLPKFLQQARGYSFHSMTDFMALYYIAAGIGSFAAGGATGLLARRGFSVYGARMTVFALCCLLTTTTTLVALLPAGTALLVVLLIIGFGGLGSYTAYYSMTQDLSTAHQGKISGTLSTVTWLVTAAFHPLFGRYLDATKNYDFVIGLSGWLPMVALIAVLALWKTPREKPLPLPEEWSTKPEAVTTIQAPESGIQP